MRCASLRGRYVDPREVRFRRCRRLVLRSSSRVTPTGRAYRIALCRRCRRRRGLL